MKHKFLLLAGALLLSWQVFAESGSCGTNLTWNLTGSTLTISGTGAMTDYSEYSSNRAPWYSYRSSITSVVINAGVTSIGDFAFCDCSSLTSVTIPNSVTSIGDDAFYECSSLASVTIPNSVISIGDNAFTGCSSLASVTIPNSVTNIGHGVFYNCSSLTSPLYNAHVFAYMPASYSGTYAIPNGIESIASAAFVYCSSLVSVTIPNSVISIGNNAFTGCSSLASVTIPNSVTSIGYHAFYGCSSLTSVTIPNSVTSISSSAFSDCTGLTSVTVPNSVTSIGEYAFQYCSSLTSIEIPNSVTSIGDWAFLGCSSLPVEDNLRYADTYLVEAVDKTLSSYTIKDGTKWIGSSAFANCSSLISVTIPNSVTSIGYRAFSNCSSLTSPIYNAYVFAYMPTSYSGAYTIPEGIKSIAGGAFGYCSSLTSVTIPNSVTSIGKRAFYNCRSMISIKIPNSVSFIGWDAFGECENLQTAIFMCRDEVPIEMSAAFPTSCSLLYTENIVAPKIIVTPEQDTFNSGKIKIYDVYCTSTTYVGWGTIDNRRSDPYDYNYALSSYDYFTLNGKMYNIHSSSNGEYNDMKYQGITDIPSYVIDNLSSGYYRLVFYTDCDSVVEQFHINCHGVNIDGIYYTLEDFYDELYVTYRGTSSKDYDEYSGDITIPETVSFHDKVYPIRKIGAEAFYKCQNLNSVTLLSADCQLTRDYVGSGSIYAYSGLEYGWDGSTWMGEWYVKYTTIPIYVPYGSLESYKQRHPTEEKYGLMNFHILNKAHIASDTGATSVHISFGNSEDQKHIVSCGLEDGETFTGYIAEYVSLEPNSEYKDMPFFINTREGEYDTIHYSFTTSALELTTKPSKPVSSTTAILLAETNMSDAETSCGFEYKRNDAPADMDGTKVYCPVASGQMAGRLKNLKDDVYYKYRAFYQSAAGNMYYGDWQYIFTGDVAVEFDPILYTYGATVVRENEATISGYALAGSEDFTEQGFEIWAEERANGGANAPRRMPAAIGEHQYVQASGISLRVTLTNLDAGTVYKYRVYGKVGDQYYYGSEQAFTTAGTYTPPTYTITFANWDGTELQSSQVEEGTIPEYTGTTPERPEDEQNTYSFNGWSPAIVAVTADATYTAVFEATSKSEGIEDLYMDGETAPRKILRDGQIYILRGDKVYNAQGQKVM